MSSATQQPDANNGKQVILEKMYLKDASVEVPNAPGIFEGEWKPQVDVQLNTAVQKLNDQHQQVVLTVTVTAKLGDDVAYLVEVQQAGIFSLQGINEREERRAILGAYCPNLMFPFAREAVADLVQRAGFPQFLLQPMNFDALYRQHVAQSEQVPETRH